MTTLSLNAAETAAPPSKLTLAQRAILAAYGVVLWALAAIAINRLNAAGLYGRGVNAAAFAVTVPLCFALLKSVTRVARLAPAQAVAGVAFISGIGLLCDSLAVTWAPEMYGTDPARTLFGLAWLFWGVAWSLFCAL